LRFDAADLPGNVGRDTPDGSRLNDGQAGHVAYGPYFTGEPGIYVAGFYLRRTSAPAPRQLHMDVTAAGMDPFAHRSLAHADLFDDLATLMHAEFELTQPTAGVEVRLFTEEGAAIEVQSLVVFKTRARSWGGF
jgi:hypothetical protein